MRAEVSAYTGANGGVSFSDLSLDSFDLVDLRAAIETATGHTIPDPVWVRLGSPSDVLDAVGGASAGGPRSGFGLSRSVTINMPQMALSGLSESWLFKEIGDLHWSAITEGLRVSSSEMFDGNGDRLYATFTRIRVRSMPLREYTENQAFSLNASMSRYGGGIFTSEMDGESLSVQTMSSFAKRSQGGSNRSLAKGQPSIPDTCPIPSLSEKPAFVTEYGEMRKRAFSEKPIYSRDYQINPYYDINGVGLVYFAAYPLIADTCELERANGRARAMETSTTERDVFYFSNANAGDTLRYSLLLEDETGSGIASEALISNATDDAPMALIRTVKARHG